MHQNRSGINPVEFKVLVKPKAVEEKVGSIYIPDMTKDKEKYATTEGVIVAVSPLAFSYASPEEWEQASAAKPKPGDVVLHAKFAGFDIKGRDGEEYRVINDKDVVAVIQEG